MIKNTLAGFVILIFSLLGDARAGSATWSASPISGDWDTSDNWTPATVPNGPADIATFDISSITSILLHSNVELDSMVFDPATTNTYTISTGRLATLTLSGAGIVNHSALPQGIIIPAFDGAQMLVFQNEATIAGTVYVTNYGYGGTTGADIEFHDNSSAGDGTFTNNGFIYFFDHASAGHGYFINNPPRAAGLSPSVTYFAYFGFDGADNATFVNNGSATSGQLGGATLFSSAGDFGKSAAICYGGTVAGAGGGFIEVDRLAHVENMTFTAFGGTNGGDGGNMQFYGAHADNASVQVYGNSTMDLSGGGNTHIGSLEGEGTVILGSSNLIIESGRRSIFSGVIQNNGGIVQGNGGGIVKNGRGRMVLRQANSYDGGTIVTGGEFGVNNHAGSGTGRGFVRINAGTLTGSGMIAGPVTIGSGSGTGANVSPGRRGLKIESLTIQSTLTFNSDGTYTLGILSNTATADTIVANGVTINAGAQFVGTDHNDLVLASGTTFTVINNTAATPIAGVFANLADGETTTIRSNTYQANYEGGDGNDLTLTVVE